MSSGFIFFLIFLFLHVCFLGLDMALDVKMPEGLALQSFQA
jgi:hypothetical protein